MKHIIAATVNVLLYTTTLSSADANGYLRHHSAARELSVDGVFDDDQDMNMTSSNGGGGDSSSMLEEQHDELIGDGALNGSCRSIFEANPGNVTCVDYSNGTIIVGNSLMNSDNNMLDSFLGIRYATISDRFEPSEVLEIPSSGSLIDAKTHGEYCMQMPLHLSNNSEEFPMSEDCLYLNIWRPTKTTNVEDELLPVMVFIPGGGFNTGSGSDILFDGSNLAGNENVVVVTINYRLGIFGFLPTGNEGKGGMNGILDQIRALEWVKNYIHLFGGDPDLVTIFGQSAGAEAVGMLSVIPQAKGLFKRAISESFLSNTGTGGCQVGEVEPAVNVSNVLEQINCNGDCTIEYLKELDKNDLLNVTAFFGLPICDSAVLPDYTFDLYASGKINPTDMIIGTNTYDDGFILTEPEASARYNNVSITQSPMWDLFGMDKWDEEQQQGAIDAYSPTENYNGSYFAAHTQFQADIMIVCPSREFAKLAAENIDGSIYNYVFGYLSVYDYASSSGMLEMANATNIDTWTTHGAELPFVFGNNANFDGSNSYQSSIPFSQKDKHLSAEIMERWANFARYGTPHTSLSDEKWLPVVSRPSQLSVDTNNNATAADPNHLLFTGNGGVAIQSDKHKTEQCSAIYTGSIGDISNQIGDESTSVSAAEKKSFSWLLTTAIFVFGSMVI